MVENRSVAERRLDQMNRDAAVEGVAGMGVAQPVRRDLLLEAGPLRRGIHDADLGEIERSPALVAPKHRIDGRAVPLIESSCCQTLALRSTVRVLPPCQKR